MFEVYKLSRENRFSQQVYLRGLFQFPILDMVEDARILYDKNAFFSKRLKRLRKRLKELGAKRVWKGNVWSWVLKPDYQPGEVIEL